MKVGGGRDGRPWVPRFCILRAEEGRGSSWLRADAGPGVLPLAPDPEGRRQDAVHVGLARGEVAGPREEYFRGDDTMVLSPYCQNSGSGLSANTCLRKVLLEGRTTPVKLFALSLASRSSAVPF
jgi:hypothetical protein